MGDTPSDHRVRREPAGGLTAGRLDPSGQVSRPFPTREAASAAPTHLLAALVAFLLFIGTLATLSFTTRTLASRSIHALAPRFLSQKNLGIELQREAFRHPDLLPLYGSSELARPSLFHAGPLFARAPTGFAVFAVGHLGTPPLVMATALAGVGDELRGRKLVVSLSPNWFILPEGRRGRRSYARNFSRLQAGALIFSADLSLDVKRRAARRMLAFPETLARDPVLRFAVERLADESLTSRALYHAAVPLGRMQNALLAAQDRARVLAVLLANPPLRARIDRRSERLDWNAMEALGAAASRRESASNALGLEDEYWTRYGTWVEKHRNGQSDADFVRNLEGAERWADLDLLLRVLRELEARPLIVSVPLHGRYLTHLGVSRAARELVYARMRDMARAHGIPLVVFADHDEDPTFLRDPATHPSPKGWVYIGRTLDAFYHGALP